MEVHGALAYLVGAYSVFAVLLVAYASIMAMRAGRVRRDLAAARRILEERER
jgi:hypothetical protein